MLTKQPTVSPNRVSLNLKCGECTHLSRGPARFEKLCVQMGKQTFSEACPEFTPNMMKLVPVQPNALDLLARIAANCTQSQLRILAYTLRNMDYIKKTGLEFGQTVAFSLSGGDTLDQYVRGKVLGADKTGKTVYICSDFEKINSGSVFLSLLRPHVLSVEEFKVKRAALIKQGRIAEEKRRAGSSKQSLLQCLTMSAEQYELHRSKLQNTPHDYKPPSLDTVPAKWIESRNVEAMMDSKNVKGAPQRKRTTKVSTQRKKPLTKAQSKNAKQRPGTTTKRGSNEFKVDRYNNR